jgi:hypothetical protein
MGPGEREREIEKRPCGRQEAEATKEDDTALRHARGGTFRPVTSGMGTAMPVAVPFYGTSRIAPATDGLPRLRPLRKLAACLMACASLLVSLTATAQAHHRHHHHHLQAYAVKQLQPVPYTAFDGHTETLIPWQGRNVSVLVEPGIDRNPKVMTRLVKALDRAWDYYATTTGQLPATVNSLNGRDEIAEVSTIPPGCAACTLLGSTGTEIQTFYFEEMYRQIAEDNRYDQILFYEFGRSFWFWSP